MVKVREILLLLLVLLPLAHAWAGYCRVKKALTGIDPRKGNARELKKVADRGYRWAKGD